MILRIRSPFYIFFLNPVYVAARSLRSLRSNYNIENKQGTRKTGNCVTGTIENSDCYMSHKFNKSLRARFRITTELVLHNSAKLNEITNAMKL